MTTANGILDVPALGDIASARMTDGMRLLSYRAKRAKVKQGVAGSVLKIALLGDSWIGRNLFASSLADLFLADGINPSGNGWMSLDAVGSYGGDGDTSQLRGAVLTYNADWTLTDASGGGANGRNSLDGNIITTSTATATLTADTFYGETFYLYYRQKGGSFRWRIDGGSWTTVTTTTSNARTTLTVSGLASGSTHKFELDTTVNSGLGQVWVEGPYATSPNVVGVEISKAGNGGSTSPQWANNSSTSWLAAQTYYLPLINPDLIIILLNTNDQRLSGGNAVDPATTLASWEAIITNARAACPNAQILGIGPPENGAGTGSYPMSAYNDALTAMYKKYSYFEMIRFDQIWGDYAQMGTALGLFLDPYHLNAAGMRMLVETVYRNLLRP